MFITVCFLVLKAVKLSMYCCIAFAECKASKVRRFWVDRKKAFQFYGQLCQLIVQVRTYMLNNTCTFTTYSFHVYTYIHVAIQSAHSSGYFLGIF